MSYRGRMADREKAYGERHRAASACTTRIPTAAVSATCRGCSRSWTSPDDERPRSARHAGWAQGLKPTSTSRGWSHRSRGRLSTSRATRTSTGGVALCGIARAAMTGTRPGVLDRRMLDAGRGLSRPRRSVRYLGGNGSDSVTSYVRGRPEVDRGPAIGRHAGWTANVGEDHPCHRRASWAACGVSGVGHPAARRRWVHVPGMGRRPTGPTHGAEPIRGPPGSRRGRQRRGHRHRRRAGRATARPASRSTARTTALGTPPTP